MTSYLRKWINTPALIVALFTGTMATAQDQKNAFSAQEAVEYALKNTVQVKNAMLALQIQKQTNREITAAALPQINGSLNYTDYLNIPVNLLPGELAGQPQGTFIPVKFGVKHNFNYGLDAKQLLFDGQVFVGLQAGKSAIEFAEKGVEVTKEQIKANVYKIYYQVLAGRQQTSTINANIARIEKLLSDSRELLKNGFVEKLDVDKTEVTLTNLRTEKIKIDNQLAIGLQGLKFLIGMPPKQQLVLTDSLPEELFKEDVVDQVYKYEDRKEYQQLEVQEKLYEFDVKRYKLTYIPTVSVSGNFSRNAYRNTFNFFKGGEPWFNTTFIGVRVEVPIFDGFARDARIKRARFQLNQLQNTKSNLRLSIENEVEQSRINLRSAIASMEFQKKNMALAEKVYGQTTLKYGQGLGSNTEITTSQTELTAAQNNYYAALFDAIVAKIDYLRATGKL